MALFLCLHGTLWVSRLALCVCPLQGPGQLCSRPSTWQCGCTLADSHLFLKLFFLLRDPACTPSYILLQASHLEFASSFSVSHTPLVELCSLFSFWGIPMLMSSFHFLPWPRDMDTASLPGTVAPMLHVHDSVQSQGLRTPPCSMTEGRQSPNNKSMATG